MVHESDVCVFAPMIVDVDESDVEKMVEKRRMDAVDVRQCR